MALEVLHFNTKCNSVKCASLCEGVVKYLVQRCITRIFIGVKEGKRAGERERYCCVSDGTFRMFGSTFNLIIILISFPPQRLEIELGLGTGA